MFFFNLDRMFVQYLVLQVCRSTDPPQDMRNSRNFALAFLLQHYLLNTDLATKVRMDRVHVREKLLRARNKIMARLDRDVVRAAIHSAAFPKAIGTSFGSTSMN
jgi:hypothetical protein